MSEPILQFEHLPVFREALSDAIKLHESKRVDVDFSKPNRWQAFYFLTGSNITSALACLKCYELGYQNVVFQIKRSIDESVALLEYFEILPDDHPDIAKWFADEIVGPKLHPKHPPAVIPKDIEERTKARAKAWQTSEADVRKFEERRRLLYDEFSKSTHPTLSAVRYNSDRVWHQFDYFCEIVKSSPIRNFRLGGFVVTPVIQSVILYPIELTTKKPELRKRLRDYIAQFEKHNI